MKRTTLLPGLLVILTTIMACSQDMNIKTLDSKEAYQLIQNDNKLVILDVRTPGEFAQGHVNGALNIDFHQAGSLDQINKMDKNATYLVYCRTKNRSGVVVQSMSQNGFKNVIQMMDGITGWNQNQLPVEK
jgi:phage shock protein E